MKKFLFVPVLAMAAALSFSCSKDNIEGDDTASGSNTGYFAPKSVINASSNATKTTLDGNSILWAKGDAITLFGQDGKPYSYTLTDGAETTSGTFGISELPDQQVTAYAVYPAVEATLSGTSVSVNIAAAQTYVAEGFSTAYPMAAVTDDGENFTFSNLATVLSLSLKGDMSVNTITVESLDGAGIAGAATVDFAGEIPVLAAAERASSSVTLDCGGVQLTTDTETVFNFIIIPGTYEEGFKITVLNAEGNGPVKFTPTDITLSPGTIKPFGSAMDAYSVPQGFIFYSSELGWGSSWIDMTESHGLYSCKNVMLPVFDTNNNEGFRIRYSTDDGQNFGGPVYVNYGAKMNIRGANMSVPEAGRYDIYVDQLSHGEKYIYVMEPGKTPGFGICGEVGNNNWDVANAIPMEMEDGYFVARNVNAVEGNRFKIVLDTCWDKYNIGGEGNTPVTVVVNSTEGTSVVSDGGSGDDITISGLGDSPACDIWFDLGAKKVWVMTDGQTPSGL